MADPIQRTWDAFFTLLSADRVQDVGDGTTRILPGMPRPTSPCPLEDGSPVAAVLGWPSLRIAVVAPADNKKAFTDAGWTVFAINDPMLLGADHLVSLVEAVRFQRQIKESAATAQLNVSNTESVVLAALLAVGLPPGNRNRTFFDQTGRDVTTPDFAWEEAKLALYVNGHFWHGGLQLRDDLMARAAADPSRAKQVTVAMKDTVARDASKSRFLAAQGWLAMTVADHELTEAGLAKLAREVRAAYDSRLGVATAPPPPAAPEAVPAGGSDETPPVEFDANRVVMPAPSRPVPQRLDLAKAPTPAPTPPPQPEPFDDDNSDALDDGFATVPDDAAKREDADKLWSKLGRVSAAAKAASRPRD